ncbi:MULTISPECIES: hypothetical protein, partial [unclassified Salipiger]|uniref:hypothetical protein n=1 Tax=unclassified Salipiger TaxID=2640570 RepID=UPI0013B7F17E
FVAIIRREQFIRFVGVLQTYSDGSVIAGGRYDHREDFLLPFRKLVDQVISRTVPCEPATAGASLGNLSVIDSLSGLLEIAKLQHPLISPLNMDVVAEVRRRGGASIPVRVELDGSFTLPLALVDHSNAVSDQGLERRPQLPKLVTTKLPLWLAASVPDMGLEFTGDIVDDLVEALVAVFPYGISALGVCDHVRNLV